MARFFNIYHFTIFYLIASMASLVAAFLNECWLSFLRNFHETFVFALDILKAFDKVWHKVLISKLPSYGLYPFLCTLSQFLLRPFYCCSGRRPLFFS
ncbi:hypothetical protein E2C01_047802 [Portunus trituberculatus]|uniref:Reverse transcriptase domain-containing protein n=1 Tax=Portunus trituberculatus TaxID=210409 RepID=A0A5B7G8G5_PORTR|nr:hypothetical protein [Portunus trituberculatus]